MAVPTKQIFDFAVNPYTFDRGTNRVFSKGEAATSTLQREADRALLGRYAPAGVIVNEQLEVLEFRGDTHLYLHNSPGEANLSFLRMAREGIASELAAAFRKRKRDAFSKERSAH